MPTKAIQLWADAFRRAQAGRVVAISTEVQAAERVAVSPVDLVTRVHGTPIDAVVMSAERVNGFWRIHLRFDATPGTVDR